MFVMVCVVFLLRFDCSYGFVIGLLVLNVLHGFQQGFMYCYFCYMFSYWFITFTFCNCLAKCSLIQLFQLCLWF